MTNYGYLKDKDGNRLAIEDAYGYMKTSGDQTLDGSMTITGNLRLKGTSNYGNKLSFGDSDYVYLSESSDDLLEIHASKGIILGEYSTSEKAVGKWIDGKTVYRQVKTFTIENNNNYTISLNISNFDKIWIDESASFIWNEGEALGINWYYNSTDWCRMWVNTSSGVRIRYGNSSLISGRILYLTLNYTKV